MNNYKTIKLDKTMYKAGGGFSHQLENLDPTAAYTGSELAGLDAFQRQLKRFDIKVAGPGSDTVSKFFQTADSAALFPEYVTRAVAQGAQEAGVLDGILAAKTDIQSLDYRSIVTDLADTDYSTPIGEGEHIPETSIALSESLVKLKKRGRMLCTSYEAVRFQRVDVLSVALRQIGAHIGTALLRDAVQALLGGTTVPETLTQAGAALSYTDLLKLWGKFESFEMNTLLASPDMVLSMLSVNELKDPAAGLNFQASGTLQTPLGAALLRSAAVPAGTIIALDKRFALEMVTAGGITVEHDKLIDTQLERAAVTCTGGFSKIFPDAVKVLKAK